MAKAPIAHSFVLETLLDSRLAKEIRVNPMFGSHAIYVGEKIVLITRHREKSPRDNGLWVIVQPDARAAVRQEYPALRPIEMFESGKEGGPSWLNLPETADSFETDALAIVERVVERDERFGKVPISAKRKAKKKTATKKKVVKKAVRKKRKSLR